jgi:hypothetical protein
MPLDRMIEKVQLFFSATDLPNMQMFNKADTFAAMILTDKHNGHRRLVCITEVIRDNNNPTWVKNHTMDYMFEIIQEVTMRVYQQGDMKAELTNLDAHTLVGEVTFRMSDLMKNSQRLALALTREGHPTGNGNIIVKAEAITDTRDVFVCTFHGHKLPNKDGFFNTSDPFYQISRLNEDNTYNLVHKSEVVDNNLSPKWLEAKIPMVSLCNGDLDRPILIEIFDKDDGGKHQSMGEVRTSVRALVASNGNQFEVIEKSKAGKKGYTNSGHISANNCRIEHHPTFSQFVMGGCEVSMVVAIDFTGSNGDPATPGSLHNIDPTHSKFNHYEEAIVAVGNVVEAYDTDKKYPVYGFGAKVKNADGSYSGVQHCFPVKADQLEADGVQGVLSTYREKVGDFMFSGPTLIAPLINATASRATCTSSSQKYTVLLILTDGTINDMEETKTALIAASHKPMSVIIVGIGNADFSDMKVLDGDKKALTYGGQTAVRDIVQFVTYNEAAVRGASVLAQQVLAEVPDQLLQHMERAGILPHPPKH